MNRFNPSLLGVAIGAMLTTPFAHAAPPVVSNVQSAQRAGTKLVDITYDLVADGPCQVVVQASSDGGTNWGSSAGSFTGAYGTTVLPGSGKAIVWDAGTDWPHHRSAQMRVRVTACDSVPTNMAFIPAGPFEMGDAWNVGNPDERPVHTVLVSAFYMDKFEVTKELWDAVMAYGVANGFQFDNNGGAFGTGHPVHTVSWYDTVKWCNARSLKEGLAPAYYTDANQTNLYKSGQIDLTASCVNWTANGYRLPTEAEWEKAARGGLARHQYPWPSFGADYTGFIDSSKACWAQSSTMPVGSYAANAFGLNDMTGNLWELCWDWLDYSWYESPDASVSDTRGPIGPFAYRTVRGGAWQDTASTSRCAMRGNAPPSHVVDYCGFRCVRGL